VPVVDDDELVGIVARRDPLKVLARSDEDIARELEELLATEMGSPYRVTVRDGVVDLTGPPRWGVVAMTTYPALRTDPAEVVPAVGVAAAAGPVPVLSVMMSAEDAARALAKAVEYGSWRRRAEGEIPELPEARREEAASLLAAALADEPRGRWLGPAEVARMLACYGLPWPPGAGRPPEEAAAAAFELGGPVALKAVAPRLVHKTDAGAVRLGLTGVEQVQTAAVEMAEAATAAPPGTTSPPWRSCCCGSPPWSTPIRPSPSWTATRSGCCPRGWWWSMPRSGSSRPGPSRR
jgi:CBS domain-containing protein